MRGKHKHFRQTKIAFAETAKPNLSVSLFGRVERQRHPSNTKYKIQSIDKCKTTKNQTVKLKTTKSAIEQSGQLTQNTKYEIQSIDKCKTTKMQNC